MYLARGTGKEKLLALAWGRGSASREGLSGAMWDVLIGNKLGWLGDWRPGYWPQKVSLHAIY
jgi:hypothetical protein